MTEIFDAAAPRVFGAPPGADFAGLIARGLRRRLAGAPPEALARVEIVVNTQRTQRAVAEAFEAVILSPGPDHAAGGAAGGATYTPRLSTLDRFADGVADAPPPEDRLARRLTLTRLVERRLAAEPALGPPGAAGPLAKTLAALLDDMQRERVGFDALSGAAGEDHAAHWREALRFLDLIGTVWPGLLAAEPARSDPEARRAAEVDALIARWAVSPPEWPIVAAGSTGSQRLTADLLVAIAGLPQGALVLPGFDFALDAEGWAAAGPDHPQYGFKRLLERLDLSPADVAPWDGAVCAPTPRARLLAEALRPAPVTHRWRRALSALSADAAPSTDGLTLIEAPGPRAEAEAIAVVMRGALERPGAVAALVTPDRTLARRVSAALGRWGVEPDDSSGRPLALTPPGAFLTMVADALVRPFDAAALLALLKHPLVRRDAGRGAHLGAVVWAETRLLRRRDRALSIRSAALLEEAFRAECDGEAARAAKDGRSSRAPDPEPLAAALAALAPLPAARLPVAAMIDALIAAATTLAGDALWDKKAGREAEAATARFRRAAEAYGEAEPAAFPALLAAALEEAGDVRDEAYRAHKRLKIWGPLEARAQTADVVILGGLNEDVWPQAPAVDPWLSRPMRAAAGLPSPERRVGLSAHDFLQAASAREAVLTRAIKADGAPTTPSRWLARLTTLLKGVEGAAGAPVLSAMRARGAARLAEAEAASAAPMGDPRPDPTPASRPAPRPPAAARPRALWVTDVEALIRDPYVVYAKRVLGLRALDEPGAPPDQRLRGEALHGAVERFVAATKDAWPAAGDAAALFDRYTEEAIAATGAPPALALAWRARLARVRDWFLREEAARRGAGRPVGVELDGETTLVAAGGPFKIRGRADRIDALTGGGLAIFDYKAGRPPSDKQIGRFAKQLHLLALIAERGGFEAAPAAPVETLAYLSLSGAGDGGSERPVAPDPGAADGIRSLVGAYDDEARAYIPRAFPETLEYASEYDHLSRFGEWDDQQEDGS